MRRTLKRLVRECGPLVRINLGEAAALLAAGKGDTVLTHVICGDTGTWAGAIGLHQVNADGYYRSAKPMPDVEVFDVYRGPDGLPE